MINKNCKVKSEQNVLSKKNHNYQNCESKKPSKKGTQKNSSIAYGVVTGDPPNLTEGGNGNGDGGGSFTS